jgi:hypothetical protein
MSWLLEIGKYIVTPVVVIGAVAWLIKTLTSQYIAKDLEGYRSELERESLRFKIRFENLHAKRAEIIAEFYRKLVSAEIAFNRLMAPFQAAGSDENDNKRHAADRAQDMQTFFFENRIYFDEGLADSVDKLMDKFRKIFIDFDTVLIKKNVTKEDYVKDWHKVWKEVQGSIPADKKKLESAFRTLLGIEK